MKSWMSLAACAAAFLAAGAAAQEAAHAPHWGYSGESGPERWAELEPGFASCGSGKNQSPVNLDDFIDADLPKLVFDYKPGGYEVINNGHAIQVNYSPGSSITVDSTAFVLKQFHFHAPSENTIDGKSFPLEAHFVHADADGNLAVVALMFEAGDTNKLLDQVWPHVPLQEGGKQALTPPVAADALLSGNRDYYRYSGSLTTPPCSEGVRWLVMKQPAHASSGQLGVVPKAIGHANNRPVQPVGARALLE